MTPTRVRLGVVVVAVVAQTGAPLPVTPSHPEAMRGSGPVVAVRRPGRIAFATTQIYTVRPDGSKERRLTSPVRDDSSAAWSPDGSKIAFVCRGGPYAYVRAQEICVIDADGSDRKRLTFDSFGDAEPSWSPDGEWIVFERNHGDAAEYAVEVEIHKMRADGSEEQQLTSNETFDAEPAWSPDGSRIAFVGYEDGDDPGIFTMAPDGSDVRLLVDEPGEPEGTPAWSPDGMKLAFAAGWKIRVLDVASRKVSKVTHGISPSWSPNGKWIVYAFFSNKAQKSSLRKVRLRDREVVTIHRGPGFSPDWGPKAVDRPSCRRGG